MSCELFMNVISLSHPHIYIHTHAFTHTPTRAHTLSLTFQRCICDTGPSKLTCQFCLLTIHLLPRRHFHGASCLIMVLFFSFICHSQQSTPVLPYLRAHFRTHTHTHTCTRTRTHTHTHTHTHTRTHTYICSHTHAHTAID